jgi:hypothetical protein
VVDDGNDSGRRRSSGAAVDDGGEATPLVKR